VDEPKRNVKTRAVKRTGEEKYFIFYIVDVMRIKQILTGNDSENGNKCAK